jgi:hypothetical protein
LRGQRLLVECVVAAVAGGDDRIACRLQHVGAVGERAVGGAQHAGGQLGGALVLRDVRQPRAGPFGLRRRGRVVAGRLHAQAAGDAVLQLGLLGLAGRDQVQRLAGGLERGNAHGKSSDQRPVAASSESNSVWLAWMILAQAW